ncbi:hypothetical protein GF362_04170 [Candidatus Dojkabacteria bacterium]|nr:hypothetical protein [Candidatus Dojkabacteria bacterium]
MQNFKSKNYMNIKILAFFVFSLFISLIIFRTSVIKAQEEIPGYAFPDRPYTPDESVEYNSATYYFSEENDIRGLRKANGQESELLFELEKIEGGGFVGIINDTLYFYRQVAQDAYYYQMFFYKLDNNDVITQIEHNDFFGHGTILGEDQHLTKFRIVENEMFFIGKDSMDSCVKIWSMDTQGNVSGAYTDCIDSFYTQIFPVGQHVYLFLADTQDRKVHSIAVIEPDKQVRGLYSTENNIDARYSEYNSFRVEDNGIYFREYNIPQELEKIMYINIEGEVKTIKIFDDYFYSESFLMVRDKFYAVAINRSVDTLHVYELNNEGIESVHSKSIEDPSSRSYIEVNGNRLEYNDGSHKELIDEYEYEGFSGYIFNLLELGIINGYNDGVFYSEKPVTRAQMAKFIVKAFGFEIDTTGEKFPDIDENHSLFPYVQTLKNSGIIGGYSDGTFKPDKTLERQEATKFMVNSLLLSDILTSFPELTKVQLSTQGYMFALKAEGPELILGELEIYLQEKFAYDESQALEIKDDNFSILFDGRQFWKKYIGVKEYPDVEKDSWGFEHYIGFVSTLESNGEAIMSGYSDGTFKPAEEMTRGQMAKVIWLSREYSTQ